jgi:hypothetical protein
MEKTLSVVRSEISGQKQKPHRYMEMSEEGNDELQRMVTSPWTFSFPNIMLVSMPSTLDAIFCFSLPTITWILGGQPRFLFIFSR